MPVCSLTGTALPVIQAPMAGVQGHRLALAVCQAGGLGSLPAGMLGTQALAQSLQALRQATDAPFNLNFFCHQLPTVDLAVETRWRQLLAPLAEELGVDLSGVPAGATRVPFNEAAAELVERFRPPVVSFHFGLPSPALLARVKASGAQVWSSATTVAEGLWLQAHGADAVIAQGLEAGGHRGHFLQADSDLGGQLPLAELLPALRQALTLPLIAAGGLATPDDVARVLALGAVAAQVGSAYLLCPEADTSAVHRAALQSASARDTALTTLFSGRPARGIVNRLMRELGPMNPAAPRFPMASAALAPLRAAAEARALGDCSPLWAGTRAHTSQPRPAGELTRWLAGLNDATTP